MVLYGKHCEAGQTSPDKRAFEFATGSWFLWPDLLGSLLQEQWPLLVLWRNVVDWG